MCGASCNSPCVQVNAEATLQTNLSCWVNVIWADKQSAGDSVVVFTTPARRIFRETLRLRLQAQGGKMHRNYIVSM